MRNNQKVRILWREGERPRHMTPTIHSYHDRPRSCTSGYSCRIIVPSKHCRRRACEQRLSIFANCDAVVKIPRRDYRLRRREASIVSNFVSSYPQAILDHEQIPRCVKGDASRLRQATGNLHGSPASSRTHGGMEVRHTRAGYGHSCLHGRRTCCCNDASRKRSQPCRSWAGCGWKRACRWHIPKQVRGHK